VGWDHESHGGFGRARRLLRGARSFLPDTAGNRGPSYPIPQGIAAWDIISIVIPDGASGCQVSITIQVGNNVSNLAPISIAPGGGTCPEIASALSGNLITLNNPYKQGLISMSRIVTNVSLGPASTMTTADNGSAVFYQIDLGMPVQLSDQIYAAFIKAAIGSCSVTVGRIATGQPAQPPVTPPASGPKPVLLDAGSVLKIVGPKVTQSMPNKANFYSAGTVITSINTPGLPPTNIGGPGFVEGGPWTLDSGAGGADIAGFQAQLANPVPVTWTNMDTITSVPRGKDLLVKWTGGDNGGYMTIGGNVTVLQTGFVSSGFWYCMVRVADGQFTVPGFVTAKLPALPVATGPGGTGVMNLVPSYYQIVNIPGVDFTTLSSQYSIGKGMAYP
jgi:hypothetical protein